MARLRDERRGKRFSMKPKRRGHTSSRRRTIRWEKGSLGGLVGERKEN